MCSREWVHTKGYHIGWCLLKLYNLCKLQQSHTSDCTHHVSFTCAKGRNEEKTLQKWSIQAEEKETWSTNVNSLFVWECVSFEIARRAKKQLRLCVSALFIHHFCLPSFVAKRTDCVNSRQNPRTPLVSLFTNIVKRENWFSLVFVHQRAEGIFLRVRPGYSHTHSRDKEQVCSNLSI